MKRGIVVVLALLMVALLISQSGHGKIDVDKLRAFLEHQYVPEIGLLRAAVVAYPDNETIYIVNDNVLAEKALRILDSPLAENLNESLTKFNYSLGKIAPLFGKPVEVFHCQRVKRVGEIYSRKFKAKFTLMTEVQDECIMRDWVEYSDLVVYAALSDVLTGNLSRAFERYKVLLRMWDGYGFRDKAFAGTYQTYKCALFVYLYRTLGEPREGREIYKKCIEIISTLQGPNGGIITGYKVEKNRIIPYGDENTETTSLVVIALQG
ncbi:hypothetical protein PNA2_0760 [Pyrococcus sp. NA2]|uniref:hypothetical protein n=1 Tax=Pyrococcus sp. (strain NA2) TaxID=342949 RepID=UPI000209AE78|nr:hypothetical protein [Pyrococcus sp. NA2]AEC51675.1 hypothetical protein PNA2_0760 [Pyrococcus sp. NA2]